MCNEVEGQTMSLVLLVRKKIFEILKNFENFNFLWYAVLYPLVFKELNLSMISYIEKFKLN